MSSMTKRATPGDKLVALSACLARVANDRDKSAFAELVQEVMTRVWLKAASYNPGLANLNTWIFTLARNCRIDYLRRNSRYATEIDPTDMFNEMEDEGPDPFQLAQQSRVEESIREGLKQLPREQSEILTKVYLEGKSHQQASDELKLPLGTVKSRVRLALKKLEVLVVR
jgi:RNA polymerase sigma-70 factor (ECF subfamily)